MNSHFLKTRLAIMNFLEFAVWGAYLTSMGNYLGKAGMGGEISWFYAIQGIVSIFMPTLMGIIADKAIQPGRLLGICHFIAGSAMLALCYIGSTVAEPDKGTFILLYTISVAFYMPTLALSNTTAFTLLKNHGMDTVKHFPPIRTFGTIGFITTMWFVNCAVWDGNSLYFTFESSEFKFQYTQMQFLVSGTLGLILFVYCLLLPSCPSPKKANGTLTELLGLDAFKLFKRREMAVFFLFSMLLGMCLQVTNAYATPFITSYSGLPETADTFAANNATLLVSISQVAEALCILFIPFFLKRFGIKTVMLIAMLAWTIRFGFFALGSPSMPGVILFVLSCIVYGVAFDFFNVSGGLFVDQECHPNMKASAQGLFMLMTNGLGATIGTLAAGYVVDYFCQWQNGYLLGNWPAAWSVFAIFALCVATAFIFAFKSKAKTQ